MRKGKKRKKRKEAEQVIGKQDRMGRLFVAPPVILFLMFTLIPMIMAIGMSFTKYDVINPPSFVGLANFKKLIHDEFFWIALKNTCVYTILYVPLGLLISLGAALFLNADQKFVGLFRTLFYLPVLSSTVATATLWFWILNPQLGLLNGILRIFGIPNQAWLYNSRLAMISIVMMSLWAGFGGNMMIFLAGLKGISPVYYEAAEDRGCEPLADVHPHHDAFHHENHLPGIYDAYHRYLPGIRPGLCFDEGRSPESDDYPGLLHLQQRLQKSEYGICVQYFTGSVCDYFTDDSHKYQDQQSGYLTGGRALWE